MKDALIYLKREKFSVSQRVEGQVRIGEVRGPLKWSTLAVYHASHETFPLCGLAPWEGEVLPFRSPATAYLVSAGDGFFVKKWGRIRRGMSLYNPLKGFWVRVKEIFFLHQPISSILSPQVLKISFEEERQIKRGEVFVGEEIPPSHEYEIETEAPDGSYRVMGHGFSASGYLSQGILKLSNPFLFFRGDFLILSSGEKKWCGKVLRIRRGEGKKVPPGSDEDVLLYLARKPISSKEITLQTGWRRAYIEELMVKLSEDGKLRILSFSDLSALSREGIEELVRKMEAKLKPFHKAKPELMGMERDKLREKLGVGREVFSLALSTAIAAGRLKMRGNAVSLADFIPEDERKLQQLEALIEGMVRPSMVEMEKLLRGLKNRRMVEQVISKLISEGVLFFTEGFLVHRDYIEDVLEKLKGRESFSIQEFKKITRLSRKYAIPLLELLDSLGITERENSHRRVISTRLRFPSQSSR